MSTNLYKAKEQLVGTLGMPVTLYIRTVGVLGTLTENAGNAQHEQ